MVGAFVFREKLIELKSLGLLGIFLINFFGNATVFFPAPAIVSVVAGGAIYPPLLVALSSGLGAALGDMIGFMFGASGKMLFIKQNFKWYEGLKGGFQKAGDVIIFVFAFIPNPFFDIIGVVAGVFRYSPRRFFVLLFAGRFIRGIILAYIGSALGAAY